MNDDRVAKLLKKIHCSKALLAMLKRLGKSPLQPEFLLEMIEQGMDKEVKELETVYTALQFLKSNGHRVQCEEKVVCHCDVNHNNWLLSENNQLYLIDWDGAMIADPAIDLGLLLYWYIPKRDWESWLNRYGLTLTEDLMLRMKWYVIAQTIDSIQWHKNKNRLQEMEKWVLFLKDIPYDN